MSVAIRYQSRGGHVREMAEIIAEGVEVEPISVDDPRAPITKPVDVLFIGGALYKFKLDPSMEAYIKSIPEGMVRKAIVFGSSATTRRPIYLMQERLKAKGIEIHPMALYMRGKPKPYLREIAPNWAAGEVKKIEEAIADGTFGQPEEAPIVQMIKAHEEKKAKEAEAKKSE
jgi:flavorubredoxin